MVNISSHLFSLSPFVTIHHMLYMIDMLYVMCYNYASGSIVCVYKVVF